MLKKFRLFIITILFTIFCLPCLAENWIPVEAKDGKIAEIDFDSVMKIYDNIQYDVKITASSNYYTITKFNIDTKNNTYAQISTTSFINGSKNDYKELDTLQYKQIKDGSLQSELYKTVSMLVGSAKNNVKRETIEKYAEEQQKKISKYWHPNNYDSSAADNQNLSLSFESYATIIIDKKGNIISYGYKDFNNNIFSSYLESDIKNIIYKKIGKFDTLPKNYDNDKLILIVKFLYSNTPKEISNVSAKDNCCTAYITISKNHSTVYKTAKDLGIFIITLPFEILFGTLSNQTP